MSKQVYHAKNSLKIDIISLKISFERVHVAPHFQWE